MILHSPIPRAVRCGTILPANRLTTEELAGAKSHISRRSCCLRLLGWGEHRLARCEKIGMDAACQAMLRKCYGSNDQHH
jgi:hypothetical protein